MASHELPFLQDMAVVTLVAAATMLLFQRARMSAVLGYILAGVIVGPYTPPFAYVHDVGVVNVLGQFGLVFLLFAVGLEFNLGKLRRAGGSTILAALLQAGLILALGFVLGRAWGFDPLEAAFLGAIISVSSTAIIVSVLVETGQRDAEWASVVMGITLLEDIIAVILLTILTAAGESSGAAAGGGLLAGSGALLLRLGLFLAAAIVIGPFLIPRLIDGLQRHFPEALLLVAVGLAFGMAIVASLLGFSVALGAFIVGALIGEAASARAVTERVAPLKELFGAVFFVTVGMLFDPRLLLEHWPLILTVAGSLLFAKVVFVAGATFLTGRTPAQSIQIGMALVPLGEFSFVLASVAGALALDAPLYAIAVGVSVVTALAAPMFIRGAPRVAALYEQRAPPALRTFASLYGTWLARSRGLARQDPLRRQATRAGVKTLLYGAASAAILAGGAALVDAFARSGIGARAAGGATPVLLAWGAVAALAGPLLYLWWASLRAHVRTLVSATLARRGREAPQRAAAVLESAFLLVGAIVFGVALLATTSRFIPSGAVLAGIALVAMTVAIVFIRALRRLQASLDRDVTRVVAGGSEDRDALAERLREVYPWAVEVREVVVPHGGAAAHRTLRELHVRNRTGASVVAIHRDGSALHNPAPDATLLPGDRLALAGEPHQVERAADLLASVAAISTPGVDAREVQHAEIRIAPRSALVGLSVSESRLRERTGATVGAVRRADGLHPGPPPDLRLQAEDVLLAVGARGAIDRLRALASTEDRSPPPMSNG